MPVALGFVSSQLMNLPSRGERIASKPVRDGG